MNTSRPDSSADHRPHDNARREPVQRSNECPYRAANSDTDSDATSAFRTADTAPDARAVDDTLRIAPYVRCHAVHCVRRHVLFVEC